MGSFSALQAQTDSPALPRYGNRDRMLHLSSQYNSEEQCDETISDPDFGLMSARNLWRTGTNESVYKPSAYPPFFTVFHIAGENNAIIF